MPDAPLARARLVAQGLVTRPFATPAAAVRAFGAMQGQDLPGVIASAALRTPAGSADEVLAELDAGSLVRGYPMRGTVFLMAAADLAWTSQLCNAGALRAAVKRRSQLGLHDTMIDRAADIAADMLGSEPRGLPRAELFAHWTAAGIPTDSGRGYHVLAHLIGRLTVCFGPWNGTDQNVVLAADWLPAGSDLEGTFNGDRIEAIAEFLRTYLTSHGPATIRDFAWWTKLPLTEIRKALPLVASEFETDGATEPSYWRPGLIAEVEALGRDIDRPLLLPGFDEFILGYADRLFAMTADHHQRLVPGNNGVFGKSLVIRGAVHGIWKRGGRPGKRTLDIDPLRTVAKTHHARLDRLFADFPFPGP